MLLPRCYLTESATTLSKDFLTKVFVWWFVSIKAAMFPLKKSVSDKLSALKWEKERNFQLVRARKKTNQTKFEWASQYFDVNWTILAFWDILTSK